MKQYKANEDNIKNSWKIVSHKVFFACSMQIDGGLKNGYYFGVRPFAGIKYTAILYLLYFVCLVLKVWHLSTS